MKPEKFHAADYTPSEVEAAKRVMIEVAQNLGEYADACVIVGGWVSALLLPEAEPKHTGSIDVDLALNPERLSGERYAIYFCVKNYRGGPIALARELRPKLRLKEVREGLKHIAGKFRSADDFGPSTVVRFLASGDADEQQFQAQDAFGLVERLLHDLGLSETKT